MCLKWVLAPDEIEESHNILLDLQPLTSVFFS